MKKHMPKSEAKPLGTPRTSKTKTPLNFPTSSELREAAEAQEEESAAEETLSLRGGPMFDGIAQEEILEEIACNANEGVAESQPTQAIEPAPKEKPMETVKLVLAPKQRKSKTLVIYNIEGRVGSVQFLRSLVGETPAPTLELSGEFVAAKEAAARVPRAKLSKEERAALPKPTLAEKVEKARLRAEKLQAKLDKATAAEATEEI